MIGAGGLGSPLGLYLAAAGIGKIGIVDFDMVDLTNLQRQVLHSTQDIGRPKLESARETLNGINPNVEIETYEERLSSENALQLFADYDIIVDGTDNFPTRYLVNDACVLLGKPNVYGSILRFDGQVSVFLAMHDGDADHVTDVSILHHPRRDLCQLCGRRSARSAAGNNRIASGSRGDKIDSR